MKDLTILLAENNDQQALQITQALNQNSRVGKVIRFRDGQEILNYLFELVDDNKYGEKNVILLDTQTPRVSGMDVLKAIKKHVALKIIPVIIFSTADDARTINSYYQCGCNAFIAKPLNPVEFERLTMLDFISVMQVPVVHVNTLSNTSSGKVI